MNMIFIFIFLFLLLSTLAILKLKTLFSAKKDKINSFLSQVFKTKQSIFLFVLNDKYYISSFFCILFLRYIDYIFNESESIIFYLNMFVCTIGYILMTWTKLFLIPIFTICFFKYFNIKIKNYKMIFIIINIVIFLIVKWYIFISWGLPFLIKILFVNIDLLFILDCFAFIFSGANFLDYFIKPSLPNTSSLSNTYPKYNRDLKYGQFSIIQSPLEESESTPNFINYYSPDTGNRSINNNSPSPSSHLSAVSLERLNSNRSASPPVSPTMSPLVGYGSLNGSLIGSPPPLLGSSPLHLASNSPLPLVLPSHSSPLQLASNSHLPLASTTPLPLVISPVRPISPELTLEQSTSEWVSKGKYNPEHNTIISSVTEPKKSILCSVLPNYKPVKPVCLDYIDPNTQQSFTMFHTTLINHYEVRAIHIPEVDRYYEPTYGIWWDHVNKRWVDSRLMYATDHDTLEYMEVNLIRKGSFSSYHLNQKLKVLQYNDFAKETIKKINAQNMLVLNTLEYISPNKLNLTQREIDEHFLSLNETKLKTFFLRIFKANYVDDVNVVVNNINNIYLNDMYVTDGVKYQTASLILQLLAQRTQIREYENIIGTKYLNYSDKYTWIKPTESIINRNKSSVSYGVPPV